MLIFTTIPREEIFMTTYFFVKVISMTSSLDYTYLNIDALSYYMYDSPTYDTTKQLRAEVDALLDGGYIVGEKIAPSLYKIPRFQFEQKIEGKFSIIYMDDIRTIINAPLRNRNKLVTYWYWLMESRYGDTKIGNMPLSYFESVTGLSKSTLVRYNKDLENLKLLYIKRSPYTNGEKENNMYCRYADRHLIKAPSKDTKSLASKYTWFMKGKEYSPNELIELYNYVVAYNEAERNKQLNIVGYIPNYKDETKLLQVFNMCDTI